MIKVKDLHMQETVKAAVDYIGSGGGVAYLRECFNRLCKDWHADEFDPDELSFDINEIVEYVNQEPWIKDIAVIPDRERTFEMIHTMVVDEFIRKYWLVEKFDITAKMVADVLRVADPLSRRHILAQRVVIECIHGLKTESQLRRLDRLMDAIAANPRLEKEYL